MKFEAPDPAFAVRIRESFNKQGIMETINGKLVAVEPGEIRIEFPFSEGITQQHGFVHAGIMTTVVDSACGYAASTLMPADTEVLTVEYKANFLSPGIGDEFLAVGKVIKPGKNIFVCQGEVMAKSEQGLKTVILMQATLMTVKNR